MIGLGGISVEKLMGGSEEGKAALERLSNMGIDTAGMSVKDAIKADRDTPARIAQEQYDYYQETFVPVERQLRGQIRSPEEIEGQVENVGIESRAISENARGEADRNLGRFGLSLDDPTQQTEMNQYLNQAGIGAEAGARTRTRLGLYDQNVENLGNYVALGRDLSTSSQGALQEASATRTGIRNTNQQLKAQDKANTVGAIAAIGTAAAVIF